MYHHVYTQPEDRIISVATLSLFRFDGPVARLWVLGQMALARRGLARDRGLRFWKLCGSGTGEGFTPRPNWGVWAILAVWEDRKAAETGIDEGAVFRRWRARAAESWTAFMDPVSARGRWAGVNPFLAGEPAQRSDGPLAVLTRATLAPPHLRRFWSRVPDISDAIGSNRDVLFKIGIGELPFLHQVTFSIWPDEASMAAFAHAAGPHATAVRAVRDGSWFSEELYARFRLWGSAGTWGGGDPVAGRVMHGSVLSEGVVR